MPAIIRSEFALALNQVATERGIDPTVVVETIKAAILAAYRKDYGATDLEQLTVDLNSDTGEAKIYREGKDVTPPGFGRIAAQTAKQVILQRIREAEKQSVLADFQSKIGTIVSGMILRFDGPNIIVDIGRAQAVMPPQEQSQNEHYHLNQRLSFYIEGIRETMRGNEIIVSRAHKNLVEGLFKREVPEVAQGAVELRIIAREAGGRTKVAVFSSQSGVDPVGSCVGQKGVRVQAVINELGGNEKVDIIQWSEDVRQFIMAALAPAKDMEILLHEDSKTAEAIVPEDQLSLAIGRDGQNVRLAAKITGWKIDIRGRKEVMAPLQTDQDGTAEQKISDQSGTQAKPVGKKAVKKSKPTLTKKAVKKSPETDENAISGEIPAETPVNNDVSDSKVKLPPATTENSEESDVKHKPDDSAQ